MSKVSGFYTKSGSSWEPKICEFVILKIDEDDGTASEIGKA